MKVYVITEKIITEKELEDTGIRTISMISEMDEIYPKMIVKFKDGIKKYFHVNEHLSTDEKFRKFLEKCIPELIS